MNEFKLLNKKINEANNILISSHVGPDGDAVGSSLGLYHYLKNRGKNVTVVLPNEFPDFIAWLKDADKIILHNKEKDRAEQLAKDADLIFSLDYNEPHRVADFQSPLENATGFKVLIDHHIGEPTWQDLNLSVVGASSTCELVFDAIFELENKSLNFLTEDIAYALYTGLLTDTGNFQYSATTPKVHKIAAHLMQAGVEADFVHNKVNNSFSENRLKFFGYCISEKLKFVEKHKLAYTFVTSNELQKYNIQTGGTEGLVNEPMKIEDVEISVLFKEDKDKIKISFRSKKNIDVSTFAKTFFEGGGHRNAAGGVSFLSLKETEQKFLNHLSNYKF